MQQWEHKILTGAYPCQSNGIHVVKYVDGEEIPNWKSRDWKIPQALNELGKDGWELVSVMWRQWGETTSGVSDPVYFLKRPAPTT